MSNISSIVSSTGHAAYSGRAASSSAAAELEKLFSKLHMDAIASSASSVPAESTTSPATAANVKTTRSSGAVTGLISGLRHVFDSALSGAKEARSAVKAVTAYTRGGGIAHVASQVVDKLA